MTAARDDSAATIESAFLRLPFEIITEILVQLSLARDILACARTCKCMRALVADSSSLQYALTLATYGLRDGASGSIALTTTAERLEHLRSSRAAWRQANITGRAPDASISLPGPGSAHDFVGGRFAKFVVKDSDEIDRARRLALVTLPSRHGAPVAHIETHDLDVTIQEFALDPSQNLLALLETPIADGTVRIHIRSLSAPAQFHPDNTLHVLESRAPTRVAKCSLDVADHVIALWVRETTPQVMVFNWRTGVLLVNMVLPDHTTYSPPTGFSFVSPHAFMLVYSSTHIIELYTIPDILPSRSHSKSPAAALILPQLKPNADIVWVNVDVGPWLAHAPPGSIHTPLNERRVHTFSLYVNDATDNDHHEFMLVVRARAFIEVLDAVANTEADGQVGDAARTWKHERWLSKHARMFSLSQSINSRRFVHGARMLAQSPDFLDLVLLNFDLPPPAQLEYNERIYTVAGPDDRLFEHDWGAIDVGNIFALAGRGRPDLDLSYDENKTLLFRLPIHRLLVTGLSYNFTSFPSIPVGEYPNTLMLDEERIVRLRSVDDGEVLDVWTF